MADELETPKLNVYYMKLTDDQVDARMGKMKRGQVVAVPKDTAERYLMAGIAEQVSSGEYEQQLERKQQKISARQQAFSSLNQAHALWDVSTHRDVLTASEDGLRAAWEAGMPLTNIEQLRDEDGDPLGQDADIEEILEARANFNPNAQFPFEAHDRSSVMGGGGHFAVQGGPQPLSPRYREYAQRIEQQDAFAQQQAAVRADDELGRKPNGPPPGRSGRATRRAQTLEGRQEPAQGGQSAPESPPAASPPPDPPPPLKPDQIGNR